LAQSSAPLPIGTALRIEGVADGPDVEVTVYAGDSATPMHTLAATGFGTTFVQARWGNPNTAPTWPALRWDNLAVSDEAIPIGPVPAVFPLAPLDLALELRVADEWVNIIDPALTTDPVTITRGRADEASQPAPAKLKTTIRDPNGEWSPRNPRSPRYGFIGRNTPIRARVGPAVPYAYMPGV
ncbi:hypothetical protein ACFQ07_06475, partial [Actinomadura adrarensis]